MGKDNGSGQLSERALRQEGARGMIRRRAAAAGVAMPARYHGDPAIGITACLMNGGTLEHAQAMAGHENLRTTKLYDHTQERLTQDEVERIRP